MRRKWQIRRQFQPTPDAERRCDQIYQHLLEWTQPEALSNNPQPQSSAEIDGEMDDENYQNNGNLRASLDGTSVAFSFSQLPQSSIDSHTGLGVWKIQLAYMLTGTAH